MDLSGHNLSAKRIVSMSELSVADIDLILDTAKAMKGISEREVKKAPTLRGRTVINCFMEPSTRTRTSFEISGKRLSADVINISGSGSSLTKGESIKDMMENLEAMKPDLLVIRSAHSGVPLQVAGWIDCPIVSAGDGRNEHPTQSLLDLMTIKETKGKLSGLNISIIGDILNSRVARSNLTAMKTVGCNVTVCGPATLLPRKIEKFADQVTTCRETAVKDADVIMTLRIQRERIGQAKFPSLREYSKHFGLNLKVMEKARKDVLLLHPGPINRGVEISPEVADGPWSSILEQVTNGVAVRMAILYLMTGGVRQN